MPQRVSCLHEIVIEKQRAVLCMLIQRNFRRNHRENLAREKFIAWLDANQIQYGLCCLADDLSYWDDLYFEVEFDENNPHYQLLHGYLENEDGTMKDPDLGFYYMPLEQAEEIAKQPIDLDDLI